MTRSGRKGIDQGDAKAFEISGISGCHRHGVHRGNRSNRHIHLCDRSTLFATPHAEFCIAIGSALIKRQDAAFEHCLDFFACREENVRLFAIGQQEGAETEFPYDGSTKIQIMFKVGVQPSADSYIPFRFSSPEKQRSYPVRSRKIGRRALASLAGLNEVVGPIFLWHKLG